MKSTKVTISKVGQRTTPTVIDLEESQSLYYRGLLITSHPECLSLITSDNFELQPRPHSPGSHIDVNAEGPEEAQQQACKMFQNDHPGGVEPNEIIFETMHFSPKPKEE